MFWIVNPPSARLDITTAEDGVLLMMTVLVPVPPVIVLLPPVMVKVSPLLSPTMVALALPVINLVIPVNLS